MARKLHPGERPPDWTAPENVKGSAFAGCLPVAGAVAAAIVVLVMFGDRTERSEVADRTAAATGQSQGTRPITDVTAQQLVDAYEANEVAAKARYDDRRLRLRGTIASIDLDLSDDPVVTFEARQRFDRPQAQFEAADAPVIGRLAKGADISVICDELTEVAGTPILSNCALVQ